MPHLGSVPVRGLLLASLYHISYNEIIKIEEFLQKNIRSVIFFQVPVYKGATNPIILPEEEIAPYHGQDGFGDLIYDHEPDTSIIKNIPASVALKDIIVKNKNDIDILCLGPLTTIALAIKLYDNILDDVRNIWIMGGNYKGIGNITPYAEFNFYVDPEAADILLNSTRKPINMLPWEACLTQNLTWQWRIENLNDQTLALALLTRAEEKFYSNSSIYRSADSIFAATFIEPEVINETSLHYGRVIRSDHDGRRGQVVLDDKNKLPKNLRIIETYNIENYKQILLKLVDFQEK